MAILKKYSSLLIRIVHFVNSKYKDGITALHVALKYKNLPIAKILLSN
ncbi:ankyrin [Orientia tsutsugamushi]|uniref:Ankyrin n=1 Tax=Orientia tsutsugamushi TaxID=784 RepID=A0A2U3R8N6_ORITS|nr:ankyrin repeat family protein [Orientia tsutsugamushi str. UT76]KJV83856.1 ankyrin repeat family protein [Orientia tsutsugamushi str. UT76]SPR09592.1 ankyrin [Orientia tsutsugamushi]